jgi:DNA-binding MarR family transcriptional regulator
VSLPALKEKHSGALADRLSVRMWLRLLSCAMVIEKRLRRGFARLHGTTLPRFDVMAALERHPEGLRMSDLSQELLVSNGNVTGLVQSLRRDGLVELLPVANDKRASLARLTPTGLAQFSELADAHHDWIETMLQDMSAAERQALHDLLGRLKASLARNTGPEDDDESA